MVELLEDRQGPGNSIRAQATCRRHHATRRVPTQDRSGQRQDPVHPTCRVALCVINGALNKTLQYFHPARDLAFENLAHKPGDQGISDGDGECFPPSLHGVCAWAGPEGRPVGSLCGTDGLLPLSHQDERVCPKA